MSHWSHGKHWTEILNVEIQIRMLYASITEDLTTQYGTAL